MKLTRPGGGEHGVGALQLIPGVMRSADESRSGRCLGLSVLALEALEDGAARFGLGDEEDDGLGEGPLEIGVADLVSCGAEALPGGASFAPDEATVRSEVADGRKREMSWIS
jgi:hypothetical protein